MVDVAVNDVGAEPGPTLVLRFADLGVATYGTLRVVGQPERTVSWVVEEPLLLEALTELDDALPELRPGEDVPDALDRTLVAGPFATPSAELLLASRLGALLLSEPAWQLLVEQGDCSPRAVLFVSPSARLARVPWGLLALGADVDEGAEGVRLLELVDVLMAVPANIVHGRRTAAAWADRLARPALLVLDPRVPNQRPDSALGSVLGRPRVDSPVGQHFEKVATTEPVWPSVRNGVELFRRTDTDRDWLVTMLSQEPSRLVFVGHATADEAGRADQAALHLADERPLTASDVIALAPAMPPRVALLACASGGDYRFDEATGLVAAIVLNGAELVTATLWTLPTTAGYRRFVPGSDDPMADAIIAVDDAHRADEAGRAVNAWQRAQLRRWRAGDVAASPVYWAALATFTVDGAR